MTTIIATKAKDTDAAISERLFELPRLVPLREATRIFGPSRSTFYRLEKSNKVKMVKLGSATFVVAESALAFFGSLPTVTTNV